MTKRKESQIMTEREQRREQPAKAMREGPQPSRYMSEGRLTIVVVALAILTFLASCPKRRSTSRTPR